MSLAATAVQKKAVTYFATFLVLVAGTASFFSLGQLEDPDFTVKTAVISTAYPGASPEEVELEVTDRIELALQNLKQVDYIKSFSRAGQSLIWVNLIPSYTTDQIPQIWDEMRRKVRDVQGSLPPGAGTPVVNDDFGDVFGHLYAVVGDGFSNADIERYTKDIKKELSVLEGVSKVDLWGVQKKIIYLDVWQSQLSQLGVSDETLEATLHNQNLVVDAGSLDLQNRRLRISPTGAFQSAEDIGDLSLRPSALDVLGSGAGAASRRTSELIRIRDIGTVSRGYAEPPGSLMRFNGAPAIAMAISNVPGVNVVDMGVRVRARLSELLEELPVGIEVQPIHVQSEVVADAVSNFLISFAEAVAIVIIVLTVGMGWRLSLIIGVALVVTILASFLLMSIFGIDLQRMSLGALIIALGMMVDNAIVVADGFVVRLQQGMDRTKAAIESAQLPSIPLLGATVVAVMAFYPIAASKESAGEYCATLFSVVAISLLVSWVVSVTLTPVQCMDLLPDPKQGADKDPYAGAFFRGFQRIVETAIRRRWLTIVSLVGLLVFSAANFGNVKQLFFPDSSMTKFMINYWAPEGARIQDTAATLKTLADLRNTVASQVEQIELPIGYTIEWGGEFESSRDSQASLLPGMIPAAVIMAFIVVALFNAYRPPIVILLTIPFAMIGMTWGLLGSGAAFGFVALLGAMSLIGMMIKNAVVLLDQVNLNLDDGMEAYDAVIDAALSRVRPVVLAAATTVLGVIPLLQDVFWIGLAVTLMAGLTFGTILTMVLVPVLYATLYRLKSPASA